MLACISYLSCFYYLFSRLDHFAPVRSSGQFSRRSELNGLVQSSSEGGLPSKNPSFDLWDCLQFSPMDFYGDDLIGGSNGFAAQAAAGIPGETPGNMQRLWLHADHLSSLNYPSFSSSAPQFSCLRVSNALILSHTKLSRKPRPLVSSFFLSKPIMTLITQCDSAVEFREKSNVGESVLRQVYAPTGNEPAVEYATFSNQQSWWAHGS